MRIVTHAVFLVGMAGSGKSTLASAYLDWLKAGDRNVMVANLDPGATALPYNPDIDAREYVDTEKLMLDYKLGPNGALIMASDLLADHLEEIREEIEDAAPDMLLVDTPGQIELFAFREGGRFIAKHLTDERRAVIYLMDTPFTRSPLNFISNLYLAAAVYSRITLPQVYALSKIDLAEAKEVDQIIDWTANPESFELALATSQEESISLITRDLAHGVFATGLLYEPIPVSAKDNIGLVELDAAVSRALSTVDESTA